MEETKLGELSMGGPVRPFFWTLLSLVLLLAFQNCAQPFETISQELSSLNGALCSSGGVQKTLKVYRRNSSLITNGLRDTFGESFYNEIKSRAGSIPADLVSESTYEGLSLESTQDQTQAYADLAEDMATRLVAKPAYLTGYLPSGCLVTNDMSKNSCLSGLLTSLLPVVYVRPVEPAELSSLLTLYTAAPGSFTEKLEAVFAVVFQSSSFLFRSPLDTERNYALASELSRLLWFSWPDKQLLAAAKNAELVDPNNLRAQISRMVKDPKSRRVFRDFVGRWLNLGRLDDFSGYSSAFKLDVVTSDALRTAMIEEVMVFAEHVVFDLNGSYRDLMTSRTAQVSHPELAKIYKVAAGSGWKDLPQERAGLLTRAAFLATGKNQINPIVTGVKINKTIVCNKIPPPSQEVIDQRDLTIDRLKLSTREYTEKRTAGGVCTSCHSMINPYGLGFSNFDGLGRWTSDDRIFTAAGALQATYASDALVNVPLDRSQRYLNGGAEMSLAIADSQQGAECFADQFSNYLTGTVDVNEAACGQKEMAAKVMAGDSVLNVWTESVLEQVNALLAK